MNKDRIINYALEKGFESFEIYQGTEEERTLRWYEGEMDSFVTSHVNGISLRGIINDKMAIVATENQNEELLIALVDKMAEQASAITSEDKGIIRKPEVSEEVKSKKNFVIHSSEEIAELLGDIEKRIKEQDERVLQVAHLEWSEMIEGRQISNSYGMDVTDKARAHIIVAAAVVKEGDDIKDGFNVEVVEDIAKFDRDKFAKKTVEKAAAKLNAKSIESGTYKVIMEKDAMRSLFAALSPMFSGELIGKGLSPLNDKLGEKIFSSKISVIDDPRNTDALMLSNYDDEGCPTRKKTLVNDGVFEMMLHNSKSAARLNTESTGNGFKAGYASAVDVRPKNCYIVPGEKSFEELLSDMGEGIVIESMAGLHAGIDFITTDFSLQCSGYKVSGGKKERPVTLITIAGNFIEMMKNVLEVGSDLEWTYQTISSPSILFEGCAISGE